ncbi:MAG TPA: EamA family transporter [Ignavibacteriaceae bacterium]|nr:EamA family transporter [Ignavibacteriaceae bacterium]
MLHSIANLRLILSRLDILANNPKLSFDFKKNMTKENWKAYIAWFNICVVWGTTYLAIRIGVADIPPMLFAGVRWLTAGTAIIIFLSLRKIKLPDKKDLLPLSVMGILMLGLGNGLVVFAEQWIPSGLTALLITTTPFWMIGIESFSSGRKKFNGTIIFGLLLGLAGILLIFGGDIKYLLIKENLIGVLSLLAAVFFWASGTVYSKYKKLSVTPLMGASVQMLAAGALQFILALFLGELSQIKFSTESTLALLYLITFGSVIGYGSYIYAIAHLPLSLISTYAYINPTIAIFLGWLVLHEEISITILFAAIIILAGVAIVKYGISKLRTIN